MAGARFVLVSSRTEDAGRTAPMLKFFVLAFKHGQGSATELEYVPLSAGGIALVEDGWRLQLKDAAGWSVQPEAAR